MSSLRSPNKVSQAPEGVANELDPGISRNVEELCETPTQFIARILGPDEKVIGNFDCKFPSQFIPVWKIVTLCIVTCGLYAVVLFYRSILRCCYRWRICTPNLVGFSFGKMAVTSKGRIICWSETVIQTKAPKSNDTAYSIVNDTRVYLLNDIKQITQYFASDAACIFCCLDYSCGIELSFNQFNHGVSHLTISPSSVVKDEFGRPAAAAVSSDSNAAYYSWARSIYGSIKSGIESTERAAGIASNLNVLQIVSYTADRNHNGDVKSVLEDLTLLHKKVMSLLPNLKDAVKKTNIDVSKISLNSDSNFDYSLSKLKFTDKFTNVTIVDSDGTVGIPDEWMPLMPDEEVLASTGQVYRMDGMQWFWSIITVGVYYCLHMRRRKYTRSAVVLTNKRIISMDIFERSGTVPLTLSNFSVQVRSYILEEISSGFISSSNPMHLSTGVETPNGFIFIEFPGTSRAAYPFAMMLQMSIKRSQMNVNMDKLKKNIQSDKTLAWDLLPLMENETPIDWIRGDRSWEPFCNNPLCLAPFNAVRSIGTLPTVDNLCSKEACSGYLFPWLPFCFSGFLRPFQIRCDLVITNLSIIRFQRAENHGLCGLPYFVTKDKFTISWESLSKFSGFNILIESAGDETCLNRCCRHLPCGKLCCPIGTSAVDLGLDFQGNYAYSISKSEANKNWLKDDQLMNNTAILTNIQFALKDHWDSESKLKDSPAVQEMHRKL